MEKIFVIKNHSIRAVLNDYKGDITKKWFISYFVNGTRQKKYEGLGAAAAADRYKAAKNLFSKIEMELQGLEFVEKKKPSLFEASILKYIDENKHLWRKKTLQSYQAKFNVVMNWAKENKVVNFDKQETKALELYLRQKLHKTTFNEYVRFYKNLWAVLMPSAHNHWNEIKKYAGDTKTPAMYFNAVQREKLAKEIKERDPYLWLFIQFMFYAFLRPGEIRLLKVSDILLVEKKILVRSEIAKNKKRQFVQMPAQLSHYIIEAKVLEFPPNYYIFSAKCEPNTNPLGMRYMAVKHQRILEGLGYDTNKYKLYSWRHTAAVCCYQNGMKIKELQLQMRHANLEETDGYLRSLGIDDNIDFAANFPTI